MNRQQVMTYFAGAGAVFLLFYWTHLGFQSAIKNTKSDIITLENRIEKTSALASKIKKSSKKQKSVTGGLLSFLQTSAEKSGLADKLGGIKPKSVPGASEAATIRLEGLNYNELIAFLRSVESYSNLESSNVKISKRYDNEKLLNLVMDISKR